MILINFNWSRRLRDGEAAETLCGEPDYMAPEVVRASGHGMAADWWGLGVRLYWMVTGASPWSMGMGLVQNEISTFQSITAHQPGGLRARRTNMPRHAAQLRPCFLLGDAQLAGGCLSMRSSV